ncbi:hypothetical protein NC652_034926 [Populus alba x Populus x berolinensis]|uniref:Uncharacterized protein n=1 Tax=Populus alba x Populus x berolinensis TaxID=444605 RepID=A0AAD6LNX8_9ROSI|nr:hypothetical protein NC652_034926 [Populus alba x Populus x berolinensis]KAJ6970360.1 hypothetical protein NC653_034833 [Populus alba x Populus x berolinensis]
MTLGLISCQGLLLPCLYQLRRIRVLRKR